LICRPGFQVIDIGRHIHIELANFVDYIDLHRKALILIDARQVYPEANIIASDLRCAGVLPCGQVLI
jgi:hypothetical protein